MLTVEDVKVVFKGDLDISYKEILDRLFFFNKKQRLYRHRINQSIDDFSMPVMKEEKGRVSIVFRDERVGQSLHILDSDAPNAELIGVVMFARNSIDTVTIVHLVLHEECSAILRRTGVNIAVVVLEQLIAVFKQLKGVKQVKMYYTDRLIKI